MMDNSNVDDLDDLDDEELFALGMRTSQRGDAGAALAYFKKLVSRSPSHAKAHWALATEYAALQMTDRASTHFERAVELDPAQPVARFQFGLLRLTCGDIEAAERIWQPLDGLGADQPVRRFKQGLLLMVRDRFDEALEVLRLAAADPNVGPALRCDIESTIARIEAGRHAQATASQEDARGPAERIEPPEMSLQSHLAFSVYGGSTGRH